MFKDLIVGGRRFRISRVGVLRVLTLHNEFIDALADPESIVDEIRRRPVVADLLTFLPPLRDERPKFPYFRESDNVAALEISTYDHWLNKQIHKNTRNKVRKAERSGVIVSLRDFNDEVAAGLVTIFNETPIRRGKRNYYFGWNLERVKAEWATELERSTWLVASCRGKCIGFIKLVIGNGVARTSGTMAMESHRDKAPMNALFAKAVQVCVGNGIPLLVYGRFTHGRKHEDSLTAFKVHNGFRAMPVPRYYVPLSLRGQVGLTLRLHRRLHEVLPATVLERLMNLRSRWYRGERNGGNVALQRAGGGGDPDGEA